MAAGLMEEKGLSASQRGELERVSDLLPKLAKAFESVPENERDVKLEELDKTPNEAFAEGLAAALDRVLAVRSALTAKAKIAVEAESRVISEGASKAKLG